MAQQQEEIVYLTKARDIPRPLESFQQLASDYELLPLSQTLTADPSSSSPAVIFQQDMYGDFNLTQDTSLLRKFESIVCNLFQIEDSVFMISGVMAQEIALSIYCKRTNRPFFLCHESSHLLLHEKNGYQELLGLTPIILPSPERQEELRFLPSQPLTAQEIIQSIELQQPQSRPSVVVIECPYRELGGKITSWEDLVLISEYCRFHSIALHMDGARLWEATVAYQKSLSEICTLFDSVYVSFYKGLGGMTGAMLLGKAPFISEARVWLRRFGGNIFTSLPYVVSAWAGLIRNVNTFEEKTQRLRSVVAMLTKLFQKDGQQQLIRFVPEVPMVSMVHVYIRGASLEVLLEIRDRVVRETSISCFTMLRPAAKMTIANFETMTLVQEAYFEFNMVFPPPTPTPPLPLLFCSPLPLRVSHPPLFSRVPRISP
jgi:threonine aldolase